MTKTKKIDYASIDVVITYPCVVDGCIVFRDTVEDYALENFEIPEEIETENQLQSYFDDLFYDSGADIVSIKSVFVYDWNRD